MQLARIAVFVIAAVCISAGAWAETALLPGDAAKGRTLHDAQCTSCHNASIYTRNDRRVKTLPGLMGQVEACNRNLNKQLSHEQVNDLIAYLNETYYRFK